MHPTDPARTALAPIDPAHEPLARAFREAGALSPATAIVLDALPATEAATIVSLAARGIIREGAPGRYYWYPDGVHEKRSRSLTAVLIGVASLVATVGLPLAAWLLSR